MAADSLAKVLEAWNASAELHSPNPGASSDGLERAQSDIGRPLPADVVELYRALDGGSLLHGNLNLLPLLPEGVTLALTTSSDLLRSWDWAIPDELLVFGDDGAGDQFGIWLPGTRDARPLIVQVGEMYGEERTLAIVGDDLPSFLLARTAYYLMLLADEEETSEALAALDLPAHLRGLDGDGDDDLFELLVWASPQLPDPRPDPYERGLTAAEVGSLARAA
jgi:hypothetical protein